MTPPTTPPATPPLTAATFAFASRCSYIGGGGGADTVVPTLMLSITVGASAATVIDSLTDPRRIRLSTTIAAVPTVTRRVIVCIPCISKRTLYWPGGTATKR